MTMTDDAEHTLNNLRQKREALVGRGHRLGEERAKLSFSAHAEADKAAQKRLDTLHGELGRFESELKSVDEAIGEATKRLAVAERAAARAADRERAEEARKLVKELGECFPYLDRKLAEAANALIAINDGIARLHAAGFAFPTDAQARLGITAIIQTWAHRLPRSWHDQLRDGFEFLAPGRRQTAVEYWAQIQASLDNQITQRLGKTESARVKEEAA
jgi:tetratricopeptide (TPR) repeat protein